MGVLQKQYVGQIRLPEGILGIFDPENEANQAHRMDKVRVFPGNYNCFINRDSETLHTISCQIVIASNSEMNEIAREQMERRRWRKFSSFIEVCSGMSGFFGGKVLNTEEWKDVVQCAQEKINKNKDEGACVISEVQDGIDSPQVFVAFSKNGLYTVHAIQEKKRNIALEIRYW